MSVANANGLYGKLFDKCNTKRIGPSSFKVARLIIRLNKELFSNVVKIIIFDFYTLFIPYIS